MSKVPQIRIRACNEAPVQSDGDYVLYWMIAFRRCEWNFSLQRAVEWAIQLRKPLVIFESLRVGYPWASDRFHRFVFDGMADNAAYVQSLPHHSVHYYPYVEPQPDADKGLLAALAKHACVVVTDDFPSFFLPRMVTAAANKLAVLLEQVDSNGVLPLRATDQVFTTAFSFRAYLQKNLPRHLDDFPEPDPLTQLTLPPLRSLPAAITRRWPAASKKVLSGNAAELAALPIDHTVGATPIVGGTIAARKRLEHFLRQHVAGYAAGANEPDEDSRSGLSPYLHFGHISPHELFHELAIRERWSPDNLSAKTGGKRQGWWGMSEGAEAWLDEFITWREIGYNLTSHTHDYDQYDSLPQWARTTLEQHQRDPRPQQYSVEQLSAAKTYDPLWNASQVQLVREGRIHNYLRMLWGKKILEWSKTPREAIDVMIELNNRYALDGRNPNSYSGIFWCLGRYDRPWGPERPIFGKIRYMSSENTRRKLHVDRYLQKYSPIGAES